MGALFYLQERVALETERVEDLELYDAVSPDDHHPHLLVGGGWICCLIQYQIHERVVPSQDALKKSGHGERPLVQQRTSTEGGNYHHKVGY